MASGIRGIMGTVSLILIAGAIVLIFFVVLSGVTGTTPLNKTYFLQADTSSIPGARAISQWTYFYVCGEGNTNCGAAVPDLPFGYAWVGNSDNAPDSLIGAHGKHTTSTYYYYLWRFGWVFYLIGLASTVIAFFTALLAPCSRLASGVSGVVLVWALFWYTLGVSLMTAEFVKARNAFHNAGMSASVGRYAFGFSWGAWAAIFLATIFLFLGCGAGGSSREEKRASRAARTNGGMTGNIGFFRRQRSRRSARGSFIDNESQRRVKDEYA